MSVNDICIGGARVEYAPGSVVLMTNPARNKKMEREKETRRGCTRDAVELHEVSKILSELKDDHVARQAFMRGANTLLLARMVENPDVSQRLRTAYLGGFERMMASRRLALG
jgi:hypothetical protein